MVKARRDGCIVSDRRAVARHDDVGHARVVVRARSRRAATRGSSRSRRAARSRPGCTATIVLAASDMPAIPAIVTPMPAWAMRRAPHRERLRRPGARGWRERDAEQPGALDEFGERARRSARPTRRRPAPASRGRSPSAATTPTTSAATAPPTTAGAAPARARARFHGSTGADRHRQRTPATASGSTVGLEVRRPDADLAAEQQVGEQRIGRAGEHHGGDGAQQDVVQHQRALARDRREQAGRRQHRRAEREQQQRAADHQRQQRRG